MTANTARPSRRTRHRKAVSATGLRGMQLAALALTDAVPALIGDDALIERERMRLEDEARLTMQAVLPLACTPAPCGDAEAARATGSVGEGGMSGCSGSPVDGSSLDTLVAGNQTRTGRVDSGRGSY